MGAASSIGAAANPTPSLSRLFPTFFRRTDLAVATNDLSPRLLNIGLDTEGWPTPPAVGRWKTGKEYRYCETVDKTDDERASSLTWSSGGTW